MRRALAIVVIVGALASPAGATESTIVPNVSIGSVRLGMTLRQVQKALGAPQTVNVRTQVHGHEFVEYG